MKTPVFGTCVGSCFKGGGSKTCYCKVPRKSDSAVAIVCLVQLSHCSGGGHHAELTPMCIMPKTMFQDASVLNSQSSQEPGCSNEFVNGNACPNQTFSRMLMTPHIACNSSAPLQRSMIDVWFGRILSRNGCHRQGRNTLRRIRHTS